MKQLFLILIPLCLIVKAQSQVSAKIEKDTIELGQMLTIKWTNHSSQDVQLSFDPSKLKNQEFQKSAFMVDSIADTNISGPITITIPKSSEVTQQIQFFSAGTFDMSESLNRPMDRILAHVILPKQIVDGGGDLAPIMPIVRAPLDYTIWIYALMVFILAGLAYYTYKKLMPQKIVPPIIEIVPSLHETVMNQLKTMQAEQLWKNGQVTQFHQSFTNTMRYYISHRYNISAQEQTTEEIYEAMSKLDNAQPFADIVKEMLSIGDLVKFAKVTPEEDIHELFLEKAFSLVTKSMKM